MRLHHLRQLTLDSPAASGNPILSAASGFVVLGNKLFVVGDDETQLAIFPRTGNEPGSTYRLFPEDLPRDQKDRKALKPDLETLVLLPPSTANPHGALLALGSGSTAKRTRGVIAWLDTDGAIQDVRVIDMSVLFASVSDLVEETNIEGAVLSGASLLLFNRGNKTHPDTTVLSVDLDALVDEGSPQVQLRATIRLPAADGVPLSVTDACSLGDGRIAISLVAEDTGDAYNDGNLAGAAVAILGPRLEVLQIEPIEPAVKIEGINAWLENEALHLLAVSDADNPDVAAGLYSGTFAVH